MLALRLWVPVLQMQGPRWPAHPWREAPGRQFSPISPPRCGPRDRVQVWDGDVRGSVYRDS